MLDSSEDEFAAGSDQEGLPARRLAETAFDACGVGDDGLVGEGDDSGGRNSRGGGRHALVGTA